MKQLSTKELISHLQDAVSWLLPVSLIVITFLILFFGISEQVGNLKVFSTRISNNVAQLKDDVAQLKGLDIPSNLNVQKNKPTVSADSASVSGIKTSYQKLQLTGDDFWGYTFSNDSAVVLAKDSVIDFGGKKALVLSYKKDATGTQTPFDLYKYSSDDTSISTKSTKTAYVLVFVEGKVVLYNDFANNDKSKLAELLKTVAASKDIDAETKSAAQSEVSKY